MSQNQRGTSANNGLRIAKLASLMQDERFLTLAEVSLRLLPSLVPAEAYAFYVYHPTRRRPLSIRAKGITREILYRFHVTLGERDDSVLSYIRHHKRPGHNKLTETKDRWISDPASRIFRESGFEYVMKAPVFVDSTLVASTNFARREMAFQTEDLQASEFLVRLLSVSLDCLIKISEQGDSYESRTGVSADFRAKEVRAARDLDRIHSIAIDPENPGFHRLTERELEIVELLGKGLTYEAVSGHLGISSNTVKQHLKHAYRKLGIRSRYELFALLLEKAKHDR